jgi:hypothetical protein
MIGSGTSYVTKMGMERLVSHKIECPYLSFLEMRSADVPVFF